MRYLMVLLVGLFLSGGVFAAGGLKSGCPTLDGCEYRTVVDINIVDAEGNSLWNVGWSGPPMSFLGNVQHAYLLIEHIFGREPGATEPKLMTIIRELND